jgi:hypothetical protein
VRKGVSGQVTVFSAIIMVAVLILAGLLVDAARISVGRRIVKRSVGMAARSLLAEYSSRLKDDYGLFVMSVPEKYELQDRFEEYLASNLGIPCDEDFYNGSADLFGFRIERADVTPIYNLSENNITKKQILEYMKYRAPTELVEGFISKLTAMKDVGKMSDAYRQKVGIDKLLGSMDKSQQKLKKFIDGSGDGQDKFVNCFNSNDCWVSAFNEFNSLTGTLADIENSLGSLENSIKSVEQQLADLKNAAGKNGTNRADKNGTSRTGNNGSSRAGSGSDWSENGTSGLVGGDETEKDIRDDLKRELDSLKKERGQLDNTRRDTINKLNDLWNRIRNPLTSDFIKSNKAAMDEISKIAQKGEKAQLLIAELEKFLDDNFSDGEGEFSKGFKEQINTELSEIKELILEGQKAAAMMEKICGNISTLEEIVQKMDEIKRSCGGALPADGLPQELISLVSSYTGIDYDYSRPEKGDRKDDPRKGKADEVKDFIYEKLLKDVNYEAAGVAKEGLPSYTKVITENFEERDMEFIGSASAVSAAGGAGAKGVSYNGDFGNVGNDVDLYDEESEFQENVLGFISDIGSLASDQAVALRDSIYINEYIMGTFKNSVPVLVDGAGTVKDTNLHGVEKEKIETFYDSEVEYILHGQPSQKMNNIMTRGELLLVRFGLNTLHVYTDPAKRTKAATVATAVAGWWTGGAGIPVISNLIMAGWGMGEAVIDVADLMKGKSVPIYKMKGDWRLDIGISSQTGPKTDRRFYFNYHDYLRLFLLAVSEDTKLSRIEDLIQLNYCKAGGRNDFRMSDCRTCVRIEAEVSMKYLFITQPFVQKEIKTGDGRYLYKVLIYEGY